MPGFLSVRPQDWATPQPATPTGTLYLVGNGVQRYDGTADTWTDRTPDTLSVGLSVAAFGDHLWVGSLSDGIFYSNDRGDTWTTISPPGSGTVDQLFTDGTTLVCIQNDPDHSITNPSDSIMASRPIDGSGSWTTLATVTGDGPIFGGSVVGSRVWFNAGATSRTFKYLTIGGSTVDTDQNATPAVQVAVKAVSGDASVAYGCQAYDLTLFQLGKIWRLVDNDGTEVTAPGGGGVTPDDDGFLDVAPNADDTVLLALLTVEGTGVGESIYRSTDQGSTWTLVNGPVVRGVANQQTCIAWSPTVPGLVAVLTTNGSALVSSDSGVTWTETSSAGDGNRAIAVL